VLSERYDLAIVPQGVMMFRRKEGVQQGVRVKLHEASRGTNWPPCPPTNSEKDLFPRGFLPLPHVKHVTAHDLPGVRDHGDQQAGRRSLERFDADFDLPDHLLRSFLRRCS